MLFINDPQYETISRPKLISVSKTQDCIEQGDQNYILEGSSFYVSSTGIYPDVVVGSTNATVVSATDCISLTGPAGGDICTTMEITLSQDFPYTRCT